MAKHKKEEVDARVEEVGRSRARGVPVAELAAKFDVSDRQIRLDQQEWLRRRRTERAADGLQLEEILAQCDEVLTSAWDDHELLGEGITSLDPKSARARSELLRIVLSVIDRKVSFLGLTAEAEGGEGGIAAEVTAKAVAVTDHKIFYREVRKLYAIMRRQMEIMVEAAKRGENIPDFVPLPPLEGEEGDGEAAWAEAFPGDGEAAGGEGGELSSPVQ